MILQIVAIRDIKADVYAQPYFVGSLGGAIRSFGDECRRIAPDNLMYNHPEDFELYELGTYDDANATFNLIKPRQISCGGNYKTSKE
ncbi:MAG: nonstructural protein [Microvirus sp.]|nr:MAG: nonstructural protein [Microvirus sp.]